MIKIVHYTLNWIKPNEKFVKFHSKVEFKDKIKGTK